MSLTVGTNSWVTVAEADAYFVDRFGAAAWATLTNTQKEQLLITAYRWIQSSSNWTISPAATANNVKNAQYETAWYIYNYQGEHEGRDALYTQGVREYQVSKMEEKLVKATYPQVVTDLLSDYITGAGTAFPTVSRTLDQ